MEYDNTNRGVLFKNDRKERDTQPDYNGSINVGGIEYWLNAWVKESQSTGKKFFSMSVKPKEEVHNAGVQQARSTAADYNQAKNQPMQAAVSFDDDIPF